MGLVMSILGNNAQETNLEITTKEAIKCNETYEAFHQYLLNKDENLDELTYKIDQTM
jgi:hypothetical protein